MEKFSTELQEMLSAGIISIDDVEKMRKIRVERILMDNDVKIPKISHREKGGSTQYYCVVPARLSRTGERHQIVRSSMQEVEEAFKDEAFSVITRSGNCGLGSRPTVQQVVRLYIDHVSPRSGHVGIVKATTAEKYDRIYRNHIDGSVFGKKIASDIKVMDCENFIKGLYDAKVTTGYASQARSIVSMALDFAVAQDVIAKNYMHTVKINSLLCQPTKKRTSGVWSDDEIMAMWTASMAAWDDSKRYMYSAVTMAQIFIGCRIGELLALTWDDIDFERKTLSITKTAARYRNTDTGKKELVITTTKTQQSNRVIDLTDNAIFWLREIRRRNAHLGIISQRVVINRNGRTPKEDNLLASMKNFCQYAGVEYKPTHTARRTYATLLIDAGIPLAEVSADLGHTKISTTQNAYYKNRAEKNRVMAAKNAAFSMATPGNSTATA